MTFFLPWKTKDVFLSIYECQWAPVCLELQVKGSHMNYYIINMLNILSESTVTL